MTKNYKIKEIIKNGVPHFERVTLQEIMGFKNRLTIREYLLTLKLNPDLTKGYIWTWDDVEKLVLLKAFLDAKKGKNQHTHEQFREIEKKGELPNELFTIANKLTEQLKNDYYNKQVYL